MALPRDELLALIERIKEQDIEVKAWRAFPDENALNCPPNGEFQNATGPLSGLTVGVKDIIDVAGIPTRHGSRIYENAPPALADAQCVTLMRAAGATIVGKTVTTELATFVPSVTRNPRNLDHTPGGSSSGSAAAVAAGHVDIAIGTQTAGSIIRPAAYCGVFGFKPSFGLAPRGGVKIQSETLDTVGVFARSIEHCEAWLAAITGHTTEALYDAKHPLKLAVITDFLDHASDEMRRALWGAVDIIREAGCEVEELASPSPFAKVNEYQQVIQDYETARAYLPERASGGSRLDRHLANALDQGAKILWGTYVQAKRSINEVRSVANARLKSEALWLMPGAEGSAPVGLQSTGNPRFNRLASGLGLPSLCLDFRLPQTQMPMGLQLVGAFGCDKRLIEQGKFVFNALGFRYAQSAATATSNTLPSG